MFLNRAKLANSVKINDSEYIEGFYFTDGHRHYITHGKYDITGEWVNAYRFIKYEIEVETLAIHFPYMIDKNNNKIFAALNKSGIGGDYLTYSENDFISFYIAIYVNGQISYKKESESSKKYILSEKNCRKLSVDSIKKTLF